MAEQWYIKNRKADPSILTQKLGISRHLAQLLICRSICDAEQAERYLNPRAESPDSALALKDMDKAVALVRAAVASNARILVVGDYDVDGVMAVLIMTAALSKLTRNVAHYIPHRVYDGYGINARIVENAHMDGVGLIITCDNGISAHEAVRLAKELGMGVIVTDHHDLPQPPHGQEGGQAQAQPQPQVQDGGQAQSQQLPQPQDGGQSQPSLQPQGRDSGQAQERPPQQSPAQPPPQCGAQAQLLLRQPAGAVAGLPPADAVVNPKRPDCPYPHKELCGAAVALKFAEALSGIMPIRPTPEERDEWLCFAAIATVCDIVELVGENRALVRRGLDIMNGGSVNVGLSELIGVCGLSGRRLTTRSIGYALGPCLNAAGRLASAELSYALFAERDRAAARAIALDIREMNARRREITEDAYDSALSLIDAQRLAGDPIIVLHVARAHESVAGIVAGKLREKYGKPAIVLADSQHGMLKGSGRSVEGYNLLVGIAEAGAHLDKFGGHAMAVGLTIEKRRLGAFREALLAALGQAPQPPARMEAIDLCIGAEEVGFGLIRDLELLEPFGSGNARPGLARTGLVLERAALAGKRGNAIKLRLVSASGLRLDGVYFGDAGDFAGALGAQFGENGIFSCSGPADIIFYPEIDDFRGMRKIQLVVSAVRPSAHPAHPK
jgi:single-stranded-DNA-specific exonuclease